VSGFYNDGKAAFNTTSSSYTTSFTPTASDTVYIKVTPYSNTSAGTYAVVYSTTFTTRPPVIQDPTPLTERQWKNGEITASAKAVWYSFPVSAGTYYLWWDDASAPYSGTRTVNVKVSAYADTSLFTSEDNAWNTPKTITVTTAGTVYVLVEPEYAAATGTFGIAYSTLSNKPIDFQSISPTALNADTWKHGFAVGADTVNWYSLSVTSGTTYYLWWDEKSNAGIHSADITVSGYYSDNSPAFTAETDTAWATPISFTPDANLTLYISVKLKNYSSFGTYGIVYSTTNTRPAIDLGTIGAEELTSGTWENGELTAQNNVLWYSFQIPEYSGYLFVWWDDSGTPKSGSKTADIKVSAYRGDGTVYKGNADNDFIGIDNAWSTQQRVYNTLSDTMVYFKVEPKSSTDSTGTFGIVYLNSSTATPSRPSQ
jgi:hypothetical protein